ncbi:glutamate-5-semialdehyde dehydrogenase [Bacillus pinisoli]|uniref:glutamate-5-semialdehyde dehydrogenase n=1 Tax=Bacillus pinisoli TaxID=2901866 RepID=UPI001FF3573F|nr:glutamate-5-semialdehyde dehydrogenase [Bacillus pinisoli]
MTEVKSKGNKAKLASYELVTLTTEDKNNALKLMAEQLLIDQDHILKENEKDVQKGENNGLSKVILDRILLTRTRIEQMVNGIHLLIELEDPIGKTIETIKKDNGMVIKKNRVPLGVIGMIYEARPNVTVDAATLSIKTGNAVILRGSSSAILSNIAIVQSIHQALKYSKIPVDSVQLIEDTSRETAKELFHLHEYLDVLIPRGGKQLIDTVVREASVPVIETGAGNCHLYIDQTAEFEMAQKIVLNGKVQRPSVCNSLETVLFHKDWFQKWGNDLLDSLHKEGVEIYGDETICMSYSKAQQATEQDWYTEYLNLSISAKVVNHLSDAITHINQYGTKHSETIITNDEKHAAIFLNCVDAAVVYHNASTRFTDGFEFGYGAEIGISTQKLHARGPMGLEALTSSKYFVYGSGQIR